MATQEDWLAKFAARGAAVRRLADAPRAVTGAAGAAAVERQRAARAERTREPGQADLFARQGDLADAWRAKLAGAAGGGGEGAGAARSAARAGAVEGARRGERGEVPEGGRGDGEGKGLDW